MPSFDPSAGDVGADIDRGVGLFERARVGDAAPVEPITPARVLAVLDGSTQDACTLGLTARLKARFGAAVLVADARTTDAGAGPGETVAAGLGGTALPRTGGESHDQILAAVEASGCDLVIVPCPFGRDLENVGPDSAGTVIDVLLARCPVPLLIVREPFEVSPDASGTGGAAPFGRVAVLLIGENAAARRAAGWACGLTGGGVGQPGAVRLTLVLEREFYENVRDLLRALDPEAEITPDKIAAALRREHAKLHEALSSSAAAGGFAYGLTTHHERAEPDALTASPDHGLVVLPLERGDHASEGHVRDRVRRSANPLLVVPAQGNR